MNDALKRSYGCGLHRAFPAALLPFSESRRNIVQRDGIEPRSVECPQAAEIEPRKSRRFFQHRVEDGGEVAGRGIDDLQHLGSRGLLLQGLAEVAIPALQFLEQTHV